MKKFYLVLDTETATLPFANEIAKTSKAKRSIAIAKPLVYDIGWVIIDRTGTIYKKANYLVQETFFVPQVFNTAYYKDKRPIYMEKLNSGDISSKCWNDIMLELQSDLDNCALVSAYNACFDFKKAIPFTEKYISHLYSADYLDWEAKQYEKCIKIANGKNDSKNPDYLIPIFKLRGKEYPLLDLWGLACEKLINNDRYKNYCLSKNLWTDSVLYFKTSAETSYQYLLKDFDFIESHTALDDSIIESQILTKALKKGKVEPGINSFPFRNLGTTCEYVNKRQKYKENLRKALEDYLGTLDASTGYYKKIENALLSLD